MGVVAWMTHSVINAAAYARSTFWAQNALDRSELVDYFRVVASSYQLELAYAEGILVKSLSSLSRFSW